MEYAMEANKKRRISPGRNDHIGIRMAPKSSQLVQLNISNEKTVQRRIRFSRPAFQDEPYENMVVEVARIDRPDVRPPIGRSGNHTSAIVTFLKAAEEALIGYTYHDALENLYEMACNLEDYPGAVGNEQYERDVIKYRLDIIYYHNATDYLNWGSYLEEAAVSFVKLRNHLYLTYHRVGWGDSAGGHERVAIAAFRSEMEKWRPDYRKLADVIVKLFDTNHCEVTADDQESVMELMAMWHQHILTLIEIYPWLNEPFYIRVLNWAYSNFSYKTGEVYDLKRLLVEDSQGDDRVRHFPFPLVNYHQ